MKSLYSASVARRITWTLFAAQSLGSAALIANATVNPIISSQLNGRDELAGLPGTLLLIGAASAAQPVGWLMQRIGRRWGLTLGFWFGAFGMVLGGLAVINHLFLLFLLGLLLIGAARGAVDQSRYAAADAQLPTARARAISTVVFAGTIGSVIGPMLVSPSGEMMALLGFDRLAGSMWTGAILFTIAGFLIFVLLKPDPSDIARSMAAETVSGVRQPATPARPLSQIVRLPAAQLAFAAMLFGQVVMVLVMTVTSLHMHHHQHGLNDVSFVIMAHTLGMYGLSMFSGPLVDRIGRPYTIAIGAFLLLLGSLGAPLSLRTEWLSFALFLVGLGWNFCYIAGSTLLADTLLPSERSTIQGTSELMVNLGSATSSLSSGLILAQLGYTALGITGAALSVLPLALALWVGLRHAVSKPQQQH